MSSMWSFPRVLTAPRERQVWRVGSPAVMIAPRHAPQPNYALRRAVALAILLFVLYLLFRLVAWVLPGGGDGSGAAEAAAESSTTTTTAVSLVAPPACAFGSTITEQPGVDDWQRSIVDTDRRLPADYVPPDLVAADAAGFEARFSVRPELIEDLAALRQAAEDNGTPIEMIAAYRSVADQEQLFARREAEVGFEEAAARTARPGHSEHHLGTTVDFKTAGADDVFQSWAEEPAGRFVLDNAHRFGFLVSYPNGQQATTCYDFEPWHYRYFGRELAGRIHASGLSPREYLWHWQETGQEPTAP